jgi:hypothetical protein
VKYLSVKNFEHFQHYKDRAPTWIKLYNAVMDDEAFLELSDAERGQLVLIWLLASRRDNRIPNDGKAIARAIQSSGRVNLERFLEAGFLVPYQPASATLAEREPDASPHARPRARGEGEKRREEKNGADAPSDPVPVIVKTRAPRPARPPTPWMGRMQEAWSFGTLPPGSATLLQSVVVAAGEDEAVERLRNYCAATEARFASVRDFVAKHAAHARDARKDGPTDRAAALWNRYRRANLLTRWSRAEYERIGNELVEGGEYPGLEAFFAELKITQPWTLAQARTDGWAVSEIASRLSHAGAA